jgi:precorrin-6B methylase 1
MGLRPWLCSSLKRTVSRTVFSLRKAKAIKLVRRMSAIGSLQYASNRAGVDLSTVNMHEDPAMTVGRARR